MTFSPVRLNHAVLFVADLDRPSASTPTSSAWTSPPASHAPTPRSCGCRARATTTTSACSGSAGRRAQATRRDRPLPPGLAGRHRSTSSRRPRTRCSNAGAYTGESSHGATKSVYGADPDGNEFEIMWMLPRETVGRVRERRPGRPPRPAPARCAAGRGVPHRRPVVARTGDAAAAGDRRSHPTRRGLARRPTRTRRWSCCCTAAARNEARHHRASPTTSPSARPTPPCARRSPRAVASPGSPTAASAGRSPSRSRETMDWFRGWLDDVAPAGRPVVLVGFSGGAAFAGGLMPRRPGPLPGRRDPLRDPARSTPVSRPRPAASPAAGPRRPGRRRHRHPPRAARPHLDLPRTATPAPRPGRPRSPAGTASAPPSSPTCSGWLTALPTDGAQPHDDTQPFEIGLFTFGEITPDPPPADRSTRPSGCGSSSTSPGSPTRPGLDVFGVGEHHRPDFAIASPAGRARRHRPSHRTISSVSGFRPQPNNPAYVAAKHGVNGLTKVAALENGALNIRVNAVAPGAIDTPMLRGALAQFGLTEEGYAPQLSLLNRFGQPREVAEAQPLARLRPVLLRHRHRHPHRRRLHQPLTCRHHPRCRPIPPTLVPPPPEQIVRRLRRQVRVARSLSVVELVRGGREPETGPSALPLGPFWD